MKKLIFAAALLPLAWTGASAQGIHIGPEGVGVGDVGVGPYYSHHHGVVREYQDSEGCRVRVSHHRRPDGDVVTRRIRDCD